MLRGKCIIALVFVLFGAWGTVGPFEVSGQQRTVIAGLEDNVEYRRLIEEEGALVRRADSLDKEMASMRRMLRTDTLARTTLASAIVMAEEEGFKLRSQMARLASRINTIEQEWILTNLLSQPERTEEPEKESLAVRHARNLVYGSWFEAGLSQGEVATLRAAQEAESALPLLMAQYRADHGRLKELVREYEAAGGQEEADGIMERFDELRGELARREGSISVRWEAIFDEKTYLYNLLADKENRRGLLARFDEEMEGLREEQSRWSGSGAPAALLDYVLRKRSLVDYEIALASETGSEEAADSLRGVAAALPSPESLADLVPVVLREKLFIDYADVVVGRSPYSITNPIPEVVVPRRGIVWRVYVGSFSARPSLSVFRNASPLAVRRMDDGRFGYFAGGFPNDSLAGAAIETLRKAGFRAPSAVVWMDGVYIDPAAEAAGTGTAGASGVAGSAGGKVYMVEIAGVETLPAAAREAIAAVRDGGADIAHAEGAFIVAPLNSREAVRLRSALETLKAPHPGLEIKLREIVQQ